MSNENFKLPWQVGTARRKITPAFDVELAGLGYYLNRTGKHIRDDLFATALIIQSKTSGAAVFVALDILYANDEFVRGVRDRIQKETGIPGFAICINCSHSHNAPTATYVCGVGEVNANYVKFLAEETVRVVLEALCQAKPASLRYGTSEIGGVTFNRTRENGPVDTRLSLLLAENANGVPFAVMFNFHSHLNAHLDIDFHAISRDWPGEVVDQIETKYPEAIAMFLQGTCGDVMLRPEFTSTSRRFEPGIAIAEAAIHAIVTSRLISRPTIRALAKTIALPTRRWTLEEINRDRDEGLYRLKTGDTNNWKLGFARVIVTYPDRLPLRYDGSVDKAVEAVSRFAVEWTDKILPTLNTRPEYIETEVQAIRIGDVLFAIHSAELFSTLGLDIRNNAPTTDMFIVGYSNGALGYLPDAHDVIAKSYAADQSPKFGNRFPFTIESGAALVKGILETLDEVKK